MAWLTRILLLFMINIILGDPLTLQIKQEVRQNNCPCNGCCDPVQTKPPTTPTSPITTIKTTTTTPTTPAPTTAITTTPPYGCIFGGIPYQNGTRLLGVCIWIVCINGNWSSDGMIDIECLICKAYLDPHILTFAKQCITDENIDADYINYQNCIHGYETYAYQGVGNHSLSQPGNNFNPTWAVYSTFETCENRMPGEDISCVGTVTFKNDKHTTITIGHAFSGNNIQVNGADYVVLGNTPSIVEVDDKVYPVMAWTSGSRCLNLLGSSGIIVRYCSDGSEMQVNSVYVWAPPSMDGEPLEGLCGNFTFDGFTSREGETWPWPDSISLALRHVVPPENFTLSWKVSNTTAVNDERSNIRGKRQIQNRCESSFSVLAGIQSQCNTTVVAGFPNGVLGEILSLIHACVYDLCRVRDPDAWIKAVEQTVKEQAVIQEITIDLTDLTTLPTTRPSSPPTKEMTYHPIPITVGPDSFMLIDQEVDWTDARALCEKYGLEMYQPIDILTVAEYLNLNFDTYYWLGARGNGTHMVWNTGGVLNEDDPWRDSIEYYEVDTDYCLDYLITGNSSEVGPLVASGCDTVSYVLCDVKNTRAKFEPNRNTQQKMKTNEKQKKTKTELLKGIKEMALKSEE